VSDTQTTSLCPECLRRLPASVVRRGDDVWLERTCPEHGEAQALVWRGPPDYDEWRAAGSGPSCCDPAENPDCPTACGLCESHARQTCCVLLEVTARCDLECPICFASARQRSAPDPSIDEIEGWFRRALEAAPGCNVQLSGGEPTVRDDLPQVVALGRSLGVSFLQLNTNGLRLAADDGYAQKLAAAGLQTVFLQFDGVDDAAYLALRGRSLAALKLRAVERCAEAGLGVVLVPTVARGVNLDQLGLILSFALEHLPAVRGIHLQPLALLGRYPDALAAAGARVTLPDVMRELAAQSGGRIALDDLAPGDCEHALCSFSREYLRGADGTLVALRRDAAAESSGCCGAPTDHSPTAPRPTDKAAHVARRWSAPATGCCAEGEAPHDQWDDILRQIRENTFSVSAMAFQDAWTVDLERLRRCYLHVLASDGRFVPFCAYNLTAADGRGLGVGRRSIVGPA
jgi:7,8-dihydro-6-hydroxymethylpterin dimethyltransferase